MRIDKYTYNYVKEVLDALYDYNEFRQFLQVSNECNWEKVQVLCENMGDIYEACGATKGVLILDDLGWVIKLPFLWDYDCDLDKNGKLKKVPVHKGEDYCKLEWRNYLMAAQEGISECFAETAYWGEFHGYPIYLQEKVDCDEYRVSSSMDDSSYKSWLDYNGYEDTDENREDFYDNDYSGDSDELSEALVYDAWKSQIASKFLDFCSDNHIYDRHSGNWGYCGDDLVIVDYSGYGGWCDLSTRPNWFRICELEEAFAM